MKQKANRRDFIKAAATAVAVPYLVPGSALPVMAVAAYML